MKLFFILFEFLFQICNKKAENKSMMLRLIKLIDKIFQNKNKRNPETRRWLC
jgi:hypothetical protein